MPDPNEKDKVETPAKATPPTGPGPKGRKYTYTGKAYANPKVHLTIGSTRLRPWAMSDEEIDKLLARQPDLIRLWKVSQASA